MATTPAEKAAQKKYRERHRERLRPLWRERSKTYRETVEADPLHREKRKNYIRTYRANNRERRMLADAKSRALKGGFPCTIQLADIVIPDYCPLLGRPFGKSGPYAPSLDKIIPALGYVPGNVMVVSRRANAIKHDATLLELQTVAFNLATITGAFSK